MIYSQYYSFMRPGQFVWYCFIVLYSLTFVGCGIWLGGKHAFPWVSGGAAGLAACWLFGREIYRYRNQEISFVFEGLSCLWICSEVRDVASLSVGQTVVWEAYRTQSMLLVLMVAIIVVRVGLRRRREAGETLC